MLGVLAIAAAQQALRRWMDLDAAHFAAHLAPLHGKSLLVHIQAPRIAVLITVDNASLCIEPFIAGHQSATAYPAGLFEPTADDIANQQAALHAPSADTTLYLSTLADGLRLFNGNMGETGNVPIEGDLSFLQKLVDAFSHAKPDIGSFIQPVLGDSAAQAAHTFMDAALGQLRRHASTARWHATEWLQEDNTLLAKRWQFEQFKQRINALNTRIDRTAARIQANHNHAAPHGPTSLNPTMVEAEAFAPFSPLTPSK